MNLTLDTPSRIAILQAAIERGEDMLKAHRATFGPEHPVTKTVERIMATRVAELEALQAA